MAVRHRAGTLLPATCDATSDAAGRRSKLDAIPEPVAQTDDPETEFVTREEEAILWRALAGMPDTYREPMNGLRLRVQGSGLRPEP